MAIEKQTGIAELQQPRIDPANPPRVVTKYTAGGLRGLCWESQHELKRGLAVLRKQSGGNVRGIRDVAAPPDATKVVGTDEQLKTPTCITEQWRPPYYYRLFCAHDRPKWEVCNSQTCRRSRAEAERNWQLLAAGKLL